MACECENCKKPRKRSPAKVWWRLRSSLERNLLLVSCCGVLALVGLLTHQILARFGERRVCRSHDCIIAASTIMGYVDGSVDPCEDFYQFACGGFLRKTRGKGMHSVSMVEEKVKGQLVEVYAEEAGENDAEVVKMVKQAYKVCTASGSRENNLNTLKTLLDSLGGFPLLESDWYKAKFDWTEATYKLRQQGYVYDISLNILREKELESVKIKLPEVTQVEDAYYAGYEEMIQKVVVEMGGAEDQDVKPITNFMRKLNKIKEAYNDSSSINSSFAELREKHNYLDWLELVNNFVVDVEVEIEVEYPSALPELMRLLQQTPRRTLANYMMWKVVERYLPYLTSGIQEAYNTYQCSIGNLKPPLQEELFCIKELEALSKISTILYARKYTTEDVRTEVEGMVRLTKQVFVEVIERSEWMDEESKSKSIAQINSMEDVVGAPREYWEDSVVLSVNPFERVEVDQNTSFLELTSRMRRANWDGSDFPQANQTEKEDNYTADIITYQVSPSYQFHSNKVVVPAATPQGVFFNKNWPRYLNYGALGMIVGHELTHAFHDDMLREGLEDEVLLWSEETFEKFKLGTKCINSSSVTYDEDLPDFLGADLAILAYRRWARDNYEEGRLLGLPYSQEQLFWISRAMSHCGLPGVTSHASSQLRVEGPMMNSWDFSQAFSCPIWSRMNPSEKCQVF